MSDVPDPTDPLLGRSRIVETSTWNSDALDLLGPACLEFEPDGTGAIRFIAVRGGIDYRVSSQHAKSSVEFTWEGVSEGDSICGRAVAVLDGDGLSGTLFIHLGDESSFVAHRWTTPHDR